MNKGEFEALAGSVTDAAFEVIGFVYNFHPSIDEVRGKQQIADLFKLGGLRLMQDMLQTSCEAKQIEDAIREKSLELEALRESLRTLSNP